MTHYELLEIEPAASVEDVRAAFRRRAMATHPDLRRGNAADIRRANEEFSRLSNAYRELIDPAKRAAYDRRLETGGDGPPVGDGHSGQGRSRRRTPPPPPIPQDHGLADIDLRKYYEELDAIREEIWGTPRNTFIRDTLLHLGFLVLTIPIYVLLIRFAVAEWQAGRATLRVYAGSLTVPLLAIWSMWQLATRAARIKAAGGVLRFLKRRGRDRRHKPRRGSAIELGFMPILILAFGFVDASLIVITDRYVSGISQGVVLSLVPGVLLAWLGWRWWRGRGRSSRRTA